MSQDPSNIRQFRPKEPDMSDKDRIIYAYHAFQEGNGDKGRSLLNSVSTTYYITKFHKDISRALLARLIYPKTKDEFLQKEAEFYIVVYRLAKKIVGENISFQKAQYFHELRNELFKGFTL